MSWAHVESALARTEPDTVPSRRLNRLIQVDAAHVLEMRDPNDGQSGDPRSATRHQYVYAGGTLWRRRLPPEDVGDEWRDQPGPVRWERMDPRPPAMRSVIDVYADTAPDLPVAVVRRLRSQDAARHEGYDIRGERVSTDEAEDVAIIAGPITGAWWDVPLPPCPDCGGDLVWWEAGYVPGTRRCVGQPTGHDEERGPVYDTEGGCGSLYTVDTVAATS